MHSLSSGSREHLLTLSQRQYEHELSRREVVNGRIAWVTTMSVILLGAMHFAFNEAGVLEPGLPRKASIVLLGFAFLAVTVAFALAFRLLLMMKLHHLVEPKTIAGHMTDVLDCVRSGRTDVDPDREFFEFILEQYGNSTSINIKRNGRKMALLRCCYILLGVGALFLLLASGPIYWQAIVENW